MPVISLVMDLAEDAPSAAATLEAMSHAISASGDGELRLVRTADIDPAFVRSPGDGVIIGPGSPYEFPSRADDVITSARERGIPLVGTWGGFQHVLVEHARNLMGIDDAVHAEYGLEGTAIVDVLACSLVETEIGVDLAPGSRLARIHGTTTIVERTNCNYGLDPAHAHIADAAGLRVAGRDDTGEVRAVERPDHPFFVGTLYQPQRTTRRDTPHPLLAAFVRAATS